MKFYVYELIDPACGSTFYIGKGQGGRIDAHEVEARKGRQSPKCDRIRGIESRGQSVAKRIVRKFADEEMAYAFEAELIAQHGVEQLTNITVGGKGARSAATLRDDKLFLRGAARLIGVCQAGSVIGVSVLGEFLDYRPLLTMCRNRIAAIIRRRGLTWANRVVAGTNVVFHV